MSRLPPTKTATIGRIIDGLVEGLHADRGAHAEKDAVSDVDVLRQQYANLKKILEGYHLDRTCSRCSGPLEVHRGGQCLRCGGPATPAAHKPNRPPVAAERQRAKPPRRPPVRPEKERLGAPFKPAEYISQGYSSAFIVTMVASAFDVKPAEIYSRRRHRDIPRIRKVAYLLVREFLGLSYADTARALGRRDHSGVYKGLRTLQRALGTNLALCAKILDLRRDLKAARREA